MPKLADFLDRHPGETAWLFGKGPSLAEFAAAGGFDTAGPVRAAINDVIGAVPDCLYGFANDHINQTTTSWQHIYKKGQTLFSPSRTYDDHGSFGPPSPACEVVTYEDSADADRLTWSRRQLATGGLHIGEGTLGSAVQVLHLMGITRIIAVGIDGGQAHASGYQWQTRLMNDHFKAYNRFRNAFILSCERLGIQLEMYGKTHQQIQSTMNVRILRNTSVKGTAYTEGEPAHLSPSDAAILVQTGKARYLTAAEKTAGEPTPAAQPAPKAPAAKAAPAAKTPPSKSTAKKRSAKKSKVS